MGAARDLWNEYEAMYAKLDYGGVASLYASDAVHVDTAGRHEGREAIGAYFEEGDKPFTDISMETAQIIEEGDVFVVEWVWRATNTGPLTMPDAMEIPATHKAVELLGVSVSSVRDGKIISQRDYFDNVSMMSQLGLMPGT
jgi:ketosteroid isomerase-like protein